MPFASATGPSSCSFLLRQLPNLENRVRRAALQRHARTCRCLREGRECAICEELFARWGEGEPAA
jgi:hypothetical protein